MDLGLQDRACIVTGASRGIGLEVARQLYAEGASLLLLGRHERSLAAAAESLGPGPRARWLSLDVTAPDAGARSVAACLEHFGHLDVLVNNAGTSSVRGLEELTDEEWQAQWDINVMAPMRLMRAAVPEMAGRGWGRVVNVSSSSGKRPGQRNVAYSVAKAAELSLSRAYADFYARQGVLINAITPGPVGTELWLGPGGLADQTVQAAGQHARAGDRRRRGRPAHPPPGATAGDRRGDRVPVLGAGVLRLRRGLVGGRRCRSGDHLTVPT